MASRKTPERILDAAEELFADHGFDATSLRSITSRARVNLAAVNYHYGSKEALIQAVFARRLGPLNDERLRLLDGCQSESGGEGPSLERIVEAFIGPTLRMSHDPRGAVFMRLFGHTLSRQDDRALRLFAGEFREVVARFSEAIGNALPELEKPEVFWRMLFMVGAMAHTMALSNSLRDLSGGLCDASDVEATIRHMVPFVVAGLRAPSPRMETGGAE